MLSGVIASISNLLGPRRIERKEGGGEEGRGGKNKSLQYKIIFTCLLCMLWGGYD